MPFQETKGDNEVSLAFGSGKILRKGTREERPDATSEVLQVARSNSSLSDQGPCYRDSCPRTKRKPKSRYNIAHCVKAVLLQYYLQTHAIRRCRLHDVAWHERWSDSVEQLCEVAGSEDRFDATCDTLFLRRELLMVPRAIRQTQPTFSKGQSFERDTADTNGTKQNAIQQTKA